ncbi:LuxR C-terminal-related transcriptional regulator [Streptomyces lincolnensis]|uniref:ATP-binding protein n=1 Tax=Streptomyces lincolnensis TaxID=1915 RepID=UPI001E6558A5|nr:LuxR C-terminal-related transcriptional regulator [Streptomyces lincolnensis]MCD7438841.1 LuxR C-terminal-related transcriptional regulator [Streptomyces lincolnensis]
MGGSAPRRDHHLPVETTSFVDRRQEQAQGRELLARARLVTLTGPGGVGKTRLAARIAARVERAFPDGVRFVHLAGLHDPALVPLAVADALGLHDHSARPPLRALVEHVRDQRLLLVVDNCEHLLPACVELATALLHGTPGVRVLATSRHRLGLTEEHLLDVRPLPVPDPDGDLSAADGYPALALFADRAAAVVPGFELTAANRAAVARLCQRLDGLPLAIELAAVRMRVLGVEQLLERLDDRYRLLTSGSPGVLPRHQTLRAAVDWSHELCTDRERLVWARLAVPAGGFDLETAEAVCADGEHVRSYDVLEAVAGLVDKSVLCREPGPDGVRYRLLDTLRHYGLSRLRALDGEELATRRRHRDWMQERAAACERAWFGPRQREIVARLRADQDNLRAALEFSCAGVGVRGGAETGEVGGSEGVPAAATATAAAPAALVAPSAVAVAATATAADRLAGLRLAGTLWFYWHACGAPREGRYWLDRALEANPEPTRERARGLWVAGLLAGCPEDLTRGRRRAEDARALAHRLGDTVEAAHADYVIGVIRLFADDLPAALTHFETSVARGRVPGQHLSLVGLDQVELACALGFLGEADRAVEICEQALRLCEAHGEQWVRSYVLRMLALAHTVKRDWPRAERHVREALRLKLAVNDVLGIALTLDLAALIATEGGAHERAAVLLGGADHVWTAVDRDRWGSRTLCTTRRDSEQRVLSAIGRAAFTPAYDRGAGLGLPEIVGYALQEPGLPDHPPTTPPVQDTPPVHLTRREAQVAELVAQGLANQQIADRLVIARRTAEGHVERILTKLGFNNRSQIATWVTAQR